ncbi:DNA-binding response regulator [Bdellovibrio sp. qaytius]|nr:DNA-binding response regulator [Bdellovibrio sp. qaytius]
MQKLLLVEDNEVMRVLAANTLKDFSLSMASSLKEAQALMVTNTFDLILLDIGLPDGDGLTFLNQLSNSSGAQTPVIIISGKTDIASKVTAFSFGAEDFISKPFDPIELKARVSAKLKKIEQAKTNSDQMKIGDLVITVSKQKVIIQTAGSNEQQPVDLTTLEFKLLLSLAKHPERVYTREYLLSEVWGNDLSVTLRSVDTHVAHLRKKIHKSKVKIDTVIRSGYRLLVNS